MSSPTHRPTPDLLIPPVQVPLTWWGDPCLQFSQWLSCSGWLHITQHSDNPPSHLSVPPSPLLGLPTPTPATCLCALPTARTPPRSQPPLLGAQSQPPWGTMAPTHSPPLCLVQTEEVAGPGSGVHLPGPSAGAPTWSRPHRQGLLRGWLTPPLLLLQMHRTGTLTSTHGAELSVLCSLSPGDTDSPMSSKASSLPSPAWAIASASRGLCPRSFTGGFVSVTERHRASDGLCQPLLSGVDCIHVAVRPPPPSPPECPHLPALKHWLPSPSPSPWPPIYFMPLWT